MWYVLIASVSFIIGAGLANEGAGNLVMKGHAIYINDVEYRCEKVK